MKAQINRVTIELAQSDVLSQGVSAAVFSTDGDLRLSAEVAAGAGVEVQRQIAALGTVDVGSAALVDGGSLGVGRLLLAVCPRWGEGSERGKLANVTYECLSLAETNGIDSVAFPALSTGAFGYPVENCATTMLTQMIDYTFEDLDHLRRVVICLSDPLAFEAFEAEFLTQIEDLRRSGEGKVQM